MQKLFVRQWFLMALVLVLYAGFSYPAQLQWLGETAGLRKAILVTVLFLMALPLETTTMWHAMRHPAPALLASAINMGLVPVAAWFLAHMLSGDMATGLILASVSPCTMASAAVWTRRAGGNDTVAILVTILTNASCFLVTPLWLAVLIAQSVQIDVAPMIQNLAFLVVLPMVAGQALRQIGPIGVWADQNKARLSTLAQSGILAMVLIGSIRCGERFQSADWRQHNSFGQIVAMGCCVVVLHLTALFAGRIAARHAGMTRPDQIAVAISGSQKTLMIGLYLAIRYFGGLAMLPMVAYHVGQLVLDTVIADQWKQKAEDN